MNPRARVQILCRRAARMLRVVAIATLGLEAAYLVAINVFLSTSLFERVIDATPDAVDIHYERGWSLFPTRIHARKLSIRGTDSHLEWILRLDEVEFDCSLLALARREFHVNSAHGTGISFRARLKLASPAATEERLRSLPSIDSLGAVGLIPSEPPYAGTWDDRSWHLWTVHLEKADARHVREVWIENARFRGDADIAGGFYLKPIRSVEIGPIIVASRDGIATLDARVVAERLRMNADVALERFDPRVTGGLAILRLLSLSMDAQMAVPDVDDLGLLRGEGQRLAGRVEVPRLALRIARGVLQDGTRVDAKAENVLFDTHAHELSGAVSLIATVEHEHLAGRVVVEHLASGFSLSAPLVTATLDSAALRLDDPFGDLHAVVDVPDAELGQATRLMDMLPASSPVQVLGGALRGSAHVDVWRGESRARGRLAVRATALDVVGGGLTVRGDSTLEASVMSLRLDTLQAADARADLVVTEGSLAQSAGPGDPFLRVVGLHVEADAPEIDPARPLDALHARVEVPDAELLDQDSLRAALRVPLAVRLAARKAHFRASAKLAVEAGHPSAALEADASEVGLEYAGRRLRSAVSAHARVRDVDWHRGIFALDTAALVAKSLVLATGGSSSGVTVARVAVTAESRAFHPRDPFRELRVTADVKDARVADASALRGLLPDGVLVTGAGSGALDGHLAAEVSDHIAHGTCSLDSRGFGVTSPKLHVSGDVRASVELARWDVARRTLAGRLDVSARGLTGGFDPLATEPDFVAAALSLHASATRVDLGHASILGVKYGLQVRGAELVDARALNVFIPSSEAFAIESGRAFASVDVEADGSRKGDHARVNVDLVDAGLVLGETHVVGDFVLAAHATDSGKEGEIISLEGSRLAMRNVRVTGASTDTSGWSGDFMVESGQLRLGPMPELDADITLRARDASPILALLFRDTLSKIVAGWTRMPSLTVVTHLTIRPHQVIVSDLIASGGDVSLRGVYALRATGDGGDGGAFVLHKGIWSVGLDLDARGSHLRLFGLDGWYRKRARAVMAPH